MCSTSLIQYLWRLFPGLLERRTEKMINSDLIAYFKPIVSQFSGNDTVQLIDLTGRVTDIQANKHRLTLHLSLTAGLYRGVPPYLAPSTWAPQ
jgi:hypothetical protein